MKQTGWLTAAGVLVLGAAAYAARVEDYNIHSCGGANTVDVDDSRGNHITCDCMPGYIPTGNSAGDCMAPPGDGQGSGSGPGPTPPGGPGGGCSGSSCGNDDQCNQCNDEQQDCLDGASKDVQGCLGVMASFAQRMCSMSGGALWPDGYRGGAPTYSDACYSDPKTAGPRCTRYVSSWPSRNISGRTFSCDTAWESGMPGVSTSSGSQSTSGLDLGGGADGKIFSGSVQGSWSWTDSSGQTFSTSAQQGLNKMCADKGAKEAQNCDNDYDCGKVCG